MVTDNLGLYQLLSAPPWHTPGKGIQRGEERPSGLKGKAALKLWPLICTSSKKRETSPDERQVRRGTARARVPVVCAKEKLPEALGAGQERWDEALAVRGEGVGCEFFHFFSAEKFYKSEVSS